MTTTPKLNSENGGRCLICDEPILHRRKDATTCLVHAGMRKRPSNRARGRREKPTYFRRFVSIDGEATTKNGRYGLLATSSGAYIQNRQGLSTEEMLDFLLALPKHHTAGGGKPIYVGFAFDYDVNMILGDLPLKGEVGSIEELRATSQTKWRGYTISYFHRKIFRIARGRRIVTIYDTWGYFQSTFESALTKWDIEVPDIITKGKKARGGFHRWSMEKIREYNAAELRCHVQLMNELRRSIAPLQLTVRSWHGPAALAGYWLSSNDVKEYLVELSPNMQDVASRAYFGGRIDVRGYGFLNPCFHYDIISAYPSATRFLPDLSKIEWKRYRHIPEGATLYVARIRWQVSQATVWPPFPWRNPQGTIRYPYEGEGWYWFPELEAAQARYGECFEVLEAYVAEGFISYPLRGLIEETFQYRAELKAAGDPSHVPVKLILNSIYGKFAQQVGKAEYHNLVWAGLITSRTRAQILSVIPDDAAVVMTDSIWSASPLTVKPSESLGGWESQPENRMVVAEAGLYKAWTPDGEPTTWQRGFDRKTPVDIETLVREWLDGDILYSPVYQVHRFIGMGLASITHYQWREWRDIERTIHPVPLVGTTKRLPYLPESNGIRNGDFMSLELRPPDSDECSSPYLTKTVDPELVAYRMQDECFDEGY